MKPLRAYPLPPPGCAEPLTRSRKCTHSTTLLTSPARTHAQKSSSTTSPSLAIPPVPGLMAPNGWAWGPSNYIRRACAEDTWRVALELCVETRTRTSANFAVNLAKLDESVPGMISDSCKLNAFNGPNGLVLITLDNAVKQLTQYLCQFEHQQYPGQQEQKGSSSSSSSTGNCNNISCGMIGAGGRQVTLPPLSYLLATRALQVIEAVNVLSVYYDHARTERHVRHQSLVNQISNYLSIHFHNDTLQDPISHTDAPVFAITADTGRVCRSSGVGEILQTVVQTNHIHIWVNEMRASPEYGRHFCLVYAVPINIPSQTIPKTTTTTTTTNECTIPPPNTTPSHTRSTSHQPLNRHSSSSHHTLQHTRSSPKLRIPRDRSLSLNSLLDIDSLTNDQLSDSNHRHHFQSYQQLPNQNKKSESPMSGILEPALAAACIGSQ